MHRSCPRRMPPKPTARPAFGTVLASQMAVASLKDGKWSAARVPQVRDRSRCRPRSTGCTTAAPASRASRPTAGRTAASTSSAWTSTSRACGKSAECLVLPKPDPAQLAAMIDGRRRPRARRSARGARRAVPAPDAVRHGRVDRRRDRRRRPRRCWSCSRARSGTTSRRARSRCASTSRRRATRTRDADGPGQGRRQLRGGPRADDRGAPAAPGGPGRVLPGRLGPGDRRRELPADPRRQDPDAQPRHAVPARRHARLDPDDRAAARLRGRGARSSPSTRCSTGSRTARPRSAARRPCSSGVGTLVREGGQRISGSAAARSARTRRSCARRSSSMQRGEIPTPAGWITRV